MNILEMEAVIRAVRYFLPHLSNQSVLIRCDNTTVVQYLNIQRGTKSVNLCYKVWELWQMALKHKFQLRAADLAVVQNVLADHLRKNKVFRLDPERSCIVQNTCSSGNTNDKSVCFGGNHKLPIFCSWHQHPNAYAIDALSVTWNRMIAYAYPLICLIVKVFEHVKQYRCQILLIAPQ